jgi:hypothetical protein
MVPATSRAGTQEPENVLYIVSQATTAALAQGRLSIYQRQAQLLHGRLQMLPRMLFH